ncbi:MAG: nucleotidyltransferase [Enterococcus sp.]
MKACGIIVEYNPFHNGHAYHAQMARELSGADVVIAVMSGNFLQRGEPAIVDKWQRSQAALTNGVDLVIELPITYALQSADYFAKGSIEILQALGCEGFCFGTDSQEGFDYQKFGDFVASNQATINQTFQQLTDPKLTYPQKMTEVFRKLYPETQLDGQRPNHVLALSYAQQNALYEQPMSIYALARKGAGYHDVTLQENIASATAIRKALAQGEDVSNYLPQTMKEHLGVQVTWADYWPTLRYKIISSRHEELQEIYQMVDGLEYRLKAEIMQATNFVDYVEQVKSKRYTQTRIQRLLCYVLLNITQKEVEHAWDNNYLHLLGFTSTGQAYLKANKKKLSLPLLAKIGQAELKHCALSVRSDQLYQLGNSAIAEQNFGRFPIQRNKSMENASQS